MSRKNTSKSAFTLVEILIVVIILGILAAIVIPQFTEASNDARYSALQNDLQTVRSQLELYKVQHQDNYPTDAGIAGTKDVMLQLTSKTDMFGNIMPATGGTAAAYPLGPYLQKFPLNQFDNLNTVTSGSSAVAGDNSTGWYWDTNQKRFSPNDNQTNNGVADKTL
jgi:general secretion pathway protein G